MVLAIPNKRPRTRKAMIHYLACHERYHTLNSWNISTSYAHCIKANQLGLDEETLLAVLEMLEVEEAFWGFREALREFEIQHRQRWQIGQNGRSGGYLVLYQGGIGADSRAFCWPGKSLDQQTDFATWEIDDLKSRVDIIWSFDLACEKAVSAFVDFTKTHTVQEDEILVPHRIKIAVAKQPTCQES